MAFVVAAGMSPAFGLLSDFVQTSHGWKPSSYSLMALVAGSFGIVGNTAMGWGADRWGRRPIGVFVFSIFPLLALALYFGPGMSIPLFWIPMVFMLTGGNVLMRMVLRTRRYRCCGRSIDRSRSGDRQRIDRPRCDRRLDLSGDGAA
jgi:predicted MFS family arabinose efflux permease